MIRVAHLFDTSGPGGAETVLVTLVRGLDRERFLSFPCIRENSWMHRQLSGCGYGFYFLRNVKMLDFAFIADMVRFLKLQDIDILHSHEFFMNLYGAIVAKVAGIPHVATIHGQVEYAARKLRRRLACRAVSRSGCMVSVSGQVLNRFNREVGVSKRRIRTVYNGIEVDRFQAPPESALRSELQIPSGVPVVGMVGNLYPVKGYPYFIRAMEQVKSRFPEARFLVCGRGKLQAQLEDMAKRCGLKDSLKFLGFRPDVPLLLQLMDIFVLSSLAEGLSLSILEAMAAGKPVVVTDVGGNREIVINGETGFVVPPEDPSAIAEKVCLLLQNKEQADRMGERGLWRVKTLFSRDTMVTNYQQLYLSLLQNGQASK